MVCVRYKHHEQRRMAQDSRMGYVRYKQHGHDHEAQYCSMGYVVLAPRA
jgi:hypothetical protein